MANQYGCGPKKVNSGRKSSPGANSRGRTYQITGRNYADEDREGKPQGKVTGGHG